MAEGSGADPGGAEGAERVRAAPTKAAAPKRQLAVAGPRVLVDAVTFFAALDRKSGLMGRAAPSSSGDLFGYR